MTNQEAKNLLERYLKGECTPEEEARLEAWHNMLVDDGTVEWKTGEKAQIKNDLKTVIDARIDSRKGRVINLRLIWAAASIIFLFFSGFLAIKYINYRNSLIALVYKETVAPAGERMKLTLSDGSTIELNGSSKIRYPETFSGAVREVELEDGEAFFDIKHDSTKPFIVKARGTKITVLGTAFNVRAYKFLKNVQVTVSRGKVSVNSEGNVKYEKSAPVILLPNEQVTVGKTANDIVKRHIHSDDFIGWRQGKYLFDNEDLGNVAAMLESYYKIHIKFSDDEIKDIRFSSEFDNTDKLEDLLFTICKANKLSYTINNQQIVLSKKK